MISNFHPLQYMADQMAQAADEKNKVEAISLQVIDEENEMHVLARCNKDGTKHIAKLLIYDVGVIAWI